LKFGANYQDSLSASQSSLFGSGTAAQIPEPRIPVCEEWGFLQKLRYEKEVVGFYISGHPLDEFQYDIDKFCTARVSDLKIVNMFSGSKFESNTDANKLAVEDEEPSANDQALERFEKIKNKELAIGGLVSSANHRISKNGKPFGSFMIEDFNDQVELALFGEDYLKFKPFINEGLFLYFKGKVQERYGQKGNWEFKVQHIQLLTDVRDKLAKSITLTCYLSDLNEQLVEQIVNVIRENDLPELQKNCELRIKVVDQEQGIAIDMLSKATKVNPSNEMLRSLEQLKGIHFRLN
jgi:DNA polymerase-3 subunit alpha